MIAEYGIGIEFNQFCISQWLDDDTVDQTLMKMERQAFRCGLSSEKYSGLGEKGQKDFALEKTIWPEEKPLGDVVKPQTAVVHGPFTDLCPAAFDHRFSELARDRFDQAAAGTLRLGLNRMVVHTGFIPVIFDPKWHLEHSVKFWWDFINQQPEDFRLYIENVMDDEPYLLLNLVKEIDDPRVRICLDVGHVNAVSQVPVTEWIRQLGPWIGHFHLHNNDGKHDLHSPLLGGERLTCLRSCSRSMTAVRKTLHSLSKAVIVTIRSGGCWSRCERPQFGLRTVIVVMNSRS